LGTTLTYQNVTQEGIKRRQNSGNACYHSVQTERVLRRIFGPKRDEVAERWRKLRSEELNDLYTLRQVQFKKGAYRILLGKPKEKVPLGRLRCKWGG
jgi:hypothetical protein